MKILRGISGDLDIGMTKKELKLILKKLYPDQIESLIKRTPEYEETIQILKELEIKMYDNSRLLDLIDIQVSYYPDLINNSKKCMSLVHDSGNCVAGHQRCFGKESCIKRISKIYNVSVDYWKETLQQYIEGKLPTYRSK